MAALMFNLIQLSERGEEVLLQAFVVCCKHTAECMHALQVRNKEWTKQRDEESKGFKGWNSNSTSDIEDSVKMSDIIVDNELGGTDKKVLFYWKK